MISCSKFPLKLGQKPTHENNYVIKSKASPVITILFRTLHGSVAVILSSLGCWKTGFN